MVIEPTRARRRRLTDTVARRRHSSYVHLVLGGDLEGSRRASTSHHYWAKQGTLACNCCKRKHGAPRLDKGICSVGSRERVYRSRALTRELMQTVVLHPGTDIEGDEVALLGG